MLNLYYSSYNDIGNIVRPINQKEIEMMDEDMTNEQLIGHGALGEVYRVVGKNGQEYALKKIRKKDIRRYFREEQQEREIAIMKKIKNPYIVQFLGKSENDQYIIIKMELVKGKNLRQFLLQENLFTLREKVEFGLRVFLQILNAIAALRVKRVMNRDIKPDNIMVQIGQTIRDVKIKMIDLGQARYNTSTNLTFNKGTETHMAPEIYLSKDYGDSCDIWSFGVMVFQIFQGKHQNSNKGELNLPYRSNRNKFNAKEYFFDDIKDNLILSVTLIPKPIRYLLREMLMPAHDQRITFLRILLYLETNFDEFEEYFIESDLEKEKQKIRIMVSEQKAVQAYLREQIKIGRPLKRLVKQVFLPLKNYFDEIGEKNMDLQKIIVFVGERIYLLIEQIGELYVSSLQKQQQNDYEEQFGEWIQDYITSQQFLILKEFLLHHRPTTTPFQFTDKISKFIAECLPGQSQTIISLIKKQTA